MDRPPKRPIIDMSDTAGVLPTSIMSPRPQKYDAPMLSKGLQILETLASSDEAMSLSALAFASKHSVGEIYRAVQVLLRRNYINELSSGEFRLSGRLFEMALQIPLYDRLLSTSLPVLENVRSILGQSVFLSILVDTQHVIIGKVEAEGDFGLTIKVGYPTPWVHSTPGQLLQALSQARSAMAEPERSSMASRAIRQMWLAEPNPRLAAITDISVPVFRRGSLIAALTIPFLSFSGGPSERKCLSVVRAWARSISDEIST